MDCYKTKITTISQELETHYEFNTLNFLVKNKTTEKKFLHIIFVPFCFRKQNVNIALDDTCSAILSPGHSLLETKYVTDTTRRQVTQQRSSGGDVSGERGVIPDLELDGEEDSQNQPLLGPISNITADLMSSLLTSQPLWLGPSGKLGSGQPAKIPQGILRLSLRWSCHRCSLFRQTWRKKTFLWPFLV
ncbi:hypothetical protein RRG08_038049 [Elysia crispata]|uniref:Uncharacterized protein n=1 Tax=Elysia crispata TaxID=231223 RepID=A0AAE0ZYA3_9GAST|nr:hypothetical protein RRG08_038049 [Elysia crispata]